MTELLVIEGRTAKKDAKMAVVAEIAALWLDLAENSRTVASRSLGEVDLALWRQYSSWLYLDEF
jgi:hypothetical protein